MPIVAPKSYDSFNIIGIDPSVNNFGISIYSIDYLSRKINSIEAFTLKNQRLYDNSTLDEDLYSDRNIKIYKLKNHFINILANINPSLVICESPFYNPSMPNAYASLVQIIQTIQFACLEYNNNIYFSTIEPLLVKKTIGAGMTTGKIDVKDSVLRNELIMSKIINNVIELDEHSIDAIAIAYSFLKINNVIDLN